MLLFPLLPSTSGQEGAVLQYTADQREGGLLEWSKWSVCDNPKWIGAKEIEMGIYKCVDPKRFELVKWFPRTIMN
jgi:hypothetical protein